MKTVFDFEKIEIDIFVSGSRLSVHMDQQSIDYIISFLGKYAYKDIYTETFQDIQKYFQIKMVNGFGYDKEDDNFIRYLFIMNIKDYINGKKIEYINFVQEVLP